MSRETNFQELLQFVRIHIISVSSIPIHTYKYYIHFQRNLKRYLHNKTQRSTIHNHNMIIRFMS